MVKNNQTDHFEEEIDVLYDQINRETLRHMVEQFVTREWTSLTDDCYSLDDKVDHVLVQLKAGK